MLDEVATKSASVVLAAGKGTRMIGYEGNKTLLPLIPTGSLFTGTRPLLLEVLDNLPPGPVAVVIHHRANEVEKAVGNRHVKLAFQPVTNGTGGALLAARSFLESVDLDTVLITMGDVPLIRKETYTAMIRGLLYNSLVLLAFEPRDKAQYGMIQMEGQKILRIVEWKYWSEYPMEKRRELRFCNAGVYAVDRRVLLKYLDRLAQEPHYVRKQRDGKWVDVEEYFLTDMVEMMSRDALNIGMVEAPEEEVMGVDTPETLMKAQSLYRKRLSARKWCPRQDSNLWHRD